MESLGPREADWLQSQTAITQVYPPGRAATTQHAETRLFGDPSVSVDLLIRSLLTLGVGRKQVGRAIGAAISV